MQGAASDLAQTEAALAEVLLQAGVPTLDAAREAVAARRELDVQIKAATNTLSPHLSEHKNLDALREASATAKRRAETFAGSLNPTSDEQALSLADLETAETTQSEAVPAAEKALDEFTKQIIGLRTGEPAAAEKVQETVKLAKEHESRLSVSRERRICLPRYLIKP